MQHWTEISLRRSLLRFLFWTSDSPISIVHLERLSILVDYSSSRARHSHHCRLWLSMLVFSILVIHRPEKSYSMLYFSFNMPVPHCCRSPLNHNHRIDFCIESCSNLLSSTDASIVGIPGNLLASCSNTTEDREDLLRSLLLICRHQPWRWCSEEVCTKLLLPLVTRVDQRLTILFLLQHLLFVFKDNDQFRQDTALHHQVKQALQASSSNANDESIVRDKILFILQTYTQINT